MFNRSNLPKQLQSNRASSNTRCQRCLKLGHHTYECSNPRPYVPRPSRSKQLASAGIGSAARDKPSVEVPEEFKTGAGVGLADKILRAKEAERTKERGSKGRSGKEKERRSKSPSPRKRRDSMSSDSDSNSDDSRRGGRGGSRRKRYSSVSDSDSEDSRRAPRRSARDDSRSPVRQRRYSSSLKRPPRRASASASPHRRD